MSYIQRKIWEIVPLDSPAVIRNCPKCGEKTYYINSKKFRVNANGNCVDIWLIYNCEKCKSSWNFTIYERVKPKKINASHYKRFMDNDRLLAIEYGFDRQLHDKNKSEIESKNIEYKIEETDLEISIDTNSKIMIEIQNKYALNMRIDRFLSEQLQISRTQIKQMHENGNIRCESENLNGSEKIKDGMKIFIDLDV